MAKFSSDSGQRHYKTSYDHALVEGRIEGAYPLQKTGEISQLTQSTFVGPIDIWEGGNITPNSNGTIYPWDVADAPMWICSSSALDVGVVTVYGQRAGGSTYAADIGAETSWPITLTGQVPVPFTTDPLHVLEAISSSTLNGTVYILRSNSVTAGGIPTNAADVRAVISAGKQKTQMIVWAVPDKHVAFPSKGEAAIGFTGTLPSGTQTAKVAFRTITRGTTPSVLAKPVDLTTSGVSYFANKIPYPPPQPAGAKISVSVESFSDDMTFSGEVQFEYKHEDLLPYEFLVRIGQPGY